MRYELFYLIGASKEAQVPEVKKRIEEIVKKFGGIFEPKETLEKRRLSYDIKRDTHGIYIAQRFNLEEIENIKEINHKLNLDNGILRFIISRTDELPELKSKEERMIEMEKKEKEAINEDKKKEKSENLPKEVSDQKKTENPVSEKIDQKLEEILNI
jgi:ribosomal protein S6